MSTRDDDFASALLEALPAPSAERHLDWDAVLTRAAATAPAVAGVATHDRGRLASRLRPRVSFRRTMVAVAASAALCLGVLAWPFAGESPGVLDRARAAIGDGPVLHVVFEEEWGGTLVDLGSGVRTPLHGERELWYDPARGLHELSRFGGVVAGDQLYPPQKVPRYRGSTLVLLATGYRQALDSGRARLLGSGQVDGVAVYWIRVDAQMLPDVADGKLHEWAHDVAVARDTFEPVATRETRDGRPGPNTGARILHVESLAAGEGDFTAAALPRDGTAYMFRQRSAIELADAARVFGGRPVWAGREISGLPFAGVTAFELGTRSPGASDWDRLTGLTFAYGQGGVPEAGAIGPAPPPVGDQQSSPFIHIRVIPRPHPHLGFSGYLPPDGKALVTAATALLKSDGVYVSIQASTAKLALAAARALEPLPEHVR